MPNEPSTRLSPPPYSTPPGFIAHEYERSRELPVPCASLWTWLSTPETFTRQLWPFWVEFVAGSGVNGASGFAPGVLNVHHGPLLHAAGILTRVDTLDDPPPLTRDLHYFYGSSMLTMKLVRPILLRFGAGPAGDQACILTLRVECDVRPWIAGFWTRAQSLFWSAFFRSALAGAKRVPVRSPTEHTHSHKST
ncbi:MAG: hypothetical protein AAGI30_07905 [Planctomycetota bacterium]